MADRVTFLTANMAGKVRYAEQNGRRYIVAPLSMIVPGVLPGSKGPLYYPHEEVAKNPSQWDGIPITIQHPYHPISGSPLSAKDDGVVARQGVGILKNSHFKNKLRSEGWFDVERLKAVDNKVYESLRQGKPIEISTGLYTRNQPVPIGAVDNRGRAYTHVARDYVPDHLAVLPDSKGACSIDDGCGLLVNELVFNYDAAYPSVPNPQPTIKKTPKVKQPIVKQSLAGSAAAAMDIQDYQSRNSARRSIQVNEDEESDEGGSSDGGDASDTSNALLSNQYVINPFVSRVQQKACFAQNDPNWDCEEWSEATKGKKLPPERRSTENAMPLVGSLSAQVQRTPGSTMQRVGTQKPPQQSDAPQRAQARSDQGFGQSGYDNPYADYERNARRCPKCGGELDEDGDCEDCGYKDDDDEDTRNNQVTNGGPGSGRKKGKVNPEDIKDELHQHLKDNPKSKLSELRSKFGGDSTVNPNKPLDHPVNAALKQLRDEGKITAHDSGWGEPSFSANAASLAEDSKSLTGKKPKITFEDASEELDEEDAPAELVGKQSTKDGRNLVTPKRGAKKPIPAEGNARYTPQDEDEGDNVIPGLGVTSDDHRDIGRSGGTNNGRNNMSLFGSGNKTIQRVKPFNYLNAFSNDRVFNEFASDDQRRAFFGKFHAMGGSDSMEAHGASAKAERTGKSSDHASAAKAHKEASEVHGERGNDIFQQAHKQAAETHARKAGQISRRDKDKAKVSKMNKDAESSPADMPMNSLNTILANCACDEERNVVNSIMERINNTSEESGDGSDTDQAGDEEDSDDHDYESDEGEGLNPVAKVGQSKMKGKKLSSTMNEVMNEAVQYAEETKSRLAGQLVANVRNTSERTRLFNQFRSMTLRDLRSMTESLTPININPSLPPNYLGASGAGPTVNQGRMEQDILELPTMNYNEDN